MTTQLWLLSSIATTAWVAYLILRKDSLAQFDQPAGQLFKLNTKAAQAESVKALKAINQRLMSRWLIALSALTDSACAALVFSLKS